MLLFFPVLFRKGNSSEPRQVGNRIAVRLSDPRRNFRVGLKSPDAVEDEERAARRGQSGPHSGRSWQRLLSKVAILPGCRLHYQVESQHGGKMVQMLYS